MNNWNKELAVMNDNKKGRKYQFPESFMKILGYVKVYFGLPYRQTEGLIRTYHDTVPAVPDYHRNPQKNLQDGHRTKTKQIKT